MANFADYSDQAIWISIFESKSQDRTSRRSGLRMHRLSRILTVIAGLCLLATGNLQAQCGGCFGQPHQHHVGCQHHSPQPFHAACSSHSGCAQHAECFGHGECRHQPLCGVDETSVCPEPEDVLDNFSITFGLDRSKQPQDFGVNSLFGGRAEVNWGIPLSRSSGLGLQIGTSINYSDNTQPTFDLIGEASGRTQSFTTLGLFQRRESGFNWAIAWDHLYENYYDHFRLNQFRTRLGWELNDENEIGIRAMLSGDGHRGSANVATLRLEPLDQGSIYWQHLWENRARTTLWVGVSESHGLRNLADEISNLAGGPNAPNRSNSGERLLFGGDVHVPLTDKLALFGQGNFVTPVDSGAVDGFFGIVIYPGGGARRASTNRFAPMLPVANNTTMTIDLR